MAEGTLLSEDTTRLVRHLVAAIAYRSSKVLKTTTPEYRDMRIADGAWTAHELVHHVSLVLGYAKARLTHTDRERFDREDWDTDVKRFYQMLGDIDNALAQGVTLENPDEIYRLVQGPLADALTHVGQLAALRRLAGHPVPGENYIKANVEIGRTGIDQPEPVK